MNILIRIIKDCVSFIVYLTVCPFRKNKKAVLVYHSVDNIPVNNDPLKINVSPVLFERQMACVAKSAERFTITFDDGYKSVFKNAFPVIAKYNIKTILFLTTGYIDGKISFADFFNDKYIPPALNWDEIRRMDAAGFEIGSHSLSHKSLLSMDEKAAYQEASQSRQRLSEALGHKVRSFSYPYGAYGYFNAKTAGVLRSAGYDRMFTNVMGMDNSKENPSAIRRIRIYSYDNMLRFRMKIAGAYNWVDMVSSKLGKPYGK